MAPIPARCRRSDLISVSSRLIPRPGFHRRPNSRQMKWTRLAVALAFVSLTLLAPSALRAQATAPHITAVTPGTGKVDDSITITGENLGKDKVTAVFLSDSKVDHKAVVVDQEPTKIVIKVPDKLQPGDYNVSVEEGGAIYIQPVIFVVKT